MKTIRVSEATNTQLDYRHRWIAHMLKELRYG